MAAKKKASGNPWPRRLVAWLFGPGRTTMVIVVLIAAFIVGSWLAWHKYQSYIRGLPEYAVDPDRVEIIAPKSDWIHRDIRVEVFRHPTLDGPLSILDDDLTERISKAFASHPWVAKVDSVAKEHGKVRVTLVYRKPVCMVRVSGLPVPIDAMGVLLPNDDGDFSTVEAARYPCLLGIDGQPPGPAGTRWSDARVVGAAEIAAVLAEFWEPMRLHTITPSLAAGSAEPSFAIETHSGTRILWGSAPGATPSLGEPTVVVKVAWLRRYFADHDNTLDGPPGQPKEFDLRTSPPSVRP